MSRSRTHSKYTTEASRLLGRRIKLARKERGWSELELAERAGIARSTVQKIEQGDPGSTIGLVFEAAALVGVRLFDADREGLVRMRAETDARIALLPKHTYPTAEKVDDDF